MAWVALDAWRDAGRAGAAATLPARCHLAIAAWRQLAVLHLSQSLFVFSSREWQQPSVSTSVNELLIPQKGAGPLGYAICFGLVA